MAAEQQDVIDSTDAQRDEVLKKAGVTRVAAPPAPTAGAVAVAKATVAQAPAKTASAKK